MLPPQLPLWLSPGSATATALDEMLRRLSLNASGRGKSTSSGHSTLMRHLSQSITLHGLKYLGNARII